MAHLVFWTDDRESLVCRSPAGGEILFDGKWLPSHQKPESPFYVSPEVRAIAEKMWADRQGKLS